MILKEPNAYMEGVFKYQREVCKGLYSTEQMVAYRRRELFSPGTSNYIDDGNFDVLGHSIHGDIFTLNCPRKDLSYVFNPPRLAFKIKRELEQNQTRLLAHIHGKAESSNMAVTDLTDVFYYDDGGKLKLNSEFTSKTKFFKLDNVKLPETDKVISIKALVKYDLPERNFLNKLVKDNPKVELLTWMIDQYTVSYAFVITTDEGWLFYHAQYGSRFLLRGASAAARKELNALKS
ncbi:hypothetical protein TSMG0001 [Halocynthia phage JM-2012]|uniref:hypothetical protein n=1 Tax=Halocynthia phage JM-2012 TaxID=1173297 RepID=UPI00025C68D0|nr:hypothetical protein TSMG0001 [Halocynthia phage JM-2012]AFI55284.1 hypothetical protein TSMG0001 [Halocynthia phage JM-2012]